MNEESTIESFVVGGGGIRWTYLDAQRIRDDPPGQTSLLG
jgi:hypothetical protein